MNRARDIHLIRRLSWLAAVLLLVAARLLAPAGFMPDWKAAGLALQPCDGVVAAPPMAHHGQHHEHKQPVQHQSCPYAVAAGHSGVAPADAPAVELALPAEAMALAEAQPAPLRPSRRQQPRARGPPAIA